MYSYYSISYLTQTASSHINNALYLYRYSAFSLSILEYIDISNLSKEEARKLILEREQYFLNLLDPKFNILKTADSRFSSGRKYVGSSYNLSKRFSNY